MTPAILFAVSAVAKINKTLIVRGAVIELRIKT
jgi:hypothetical protein